MKALRIFAETVIMSAGLALVVITLSGTTRTIAIWLSAISIVFYVVSQLAEEANDD